MIKSLGLVALKEHTIEHDFKMLEKYQEYSAELLRLALIGISAIGFGASKLLFPDSEGNVATVSGYCKAFLAIALIALVVAAACALLHRYASADSMSWHMQAMRRYLTEEPAHVAKADAESRHRYRQFKVSRWSLIGASTGLGLGTIALAIAVLMALR